MIRPRLIDGRSNNSEDWRETGSDSIRRKTSIAFRTALSPSHGVEPWAARPCTIRRRAGAPPGPAARALGRGAPGAGGPRPGGREGAPEPGGHGVVAGSAPDVLGLLAGHDHEPDPD